MSVGASSSHRQDRTEAYGGYDDSYYEQGGGWITFAGVMLMLLGTINIVGGIAAIDGANFWVAGAEFVFSDLNTWGWVLLITGIVQVLAAFGIFAKNQLARWLGVGFATLNALAQLLFMVAFPLWALALFAIDVLVIYGLIVYGGRERPV
jgi:hypothetical protein